MTARAILTGVPLVPKHVFEKMDDVTTDVNKNPVTSGPFTLDEKDFTSQNYVFRANPNYHEKGQPYIDGVRYTSYAGGTAPRMQSSQVKSTGLRMYSRIRRSS